VREWVAGLKAGGVKPSTPDRAADRTPAPGSGGRFVIAGHGRPLVRRPRTTIA
jgi:hypothetical protein